LSKDSVQVLSVLDKVDLEASAGWEPGTWWVDGDLALSAVDVRDEDFLAAWKNFIIL
jgi:hypothetical protein